MAFQIGNKAYTLRKTHGRPPITPITPALVSNTTFRHLFRTYIREKEDSWFDIDAKTDTRLERLIKKAARDLIAESTPVQVIFSAFNYLEPVPKSETEGVLPDSLPEEKKELVEKISKLDLERMRRVAAIIAEVDVNESQNS